MAKKRGGKKHVYAALAANSGLAFAAFEETSTPPPPSSFAASLLRVYFIYLFCEFFSSAAFPFCLPLGTFAKWKVFRVLFKSEVQRCATIFRSTRKTDSESMPADKFKAKICMCSSDIGLKAFRKQNFERNPICRSTLESRWDLTPPLPFPYFLLIIMICLVATFVAKQFIRIPASLFIRLFTLTRPTVLCPWTCLSHVPHIWISDVISATGAFLLSPPFVWQPRWFVATEKVANGNWISPDVIYDVCLSMPEYFANISLHDFHVTMPINHTQRWKGVEMKYPWYVSFN